MEQQSWMDYLLTVMGSAVLVAVVASIAGGGQEDWKKGLRSELGTLNWRIGRKVGLIEDLTKIVKSLRERKTHYMVEHNLTVLPSVGEMRARHPKLWGLEKSLMAMEKRLKSEEFFLLMMQKRKKEIMITLGLREREPERYEKRPAMKKPPRPIARDVWGRPKKE